MSNAFTSSMFDSIKSALTKQTETTNTKFKDFLRTDAGHTFTVRILPNVKDPNKTFLHYYSYSWNSFADGKLINVVSPTTWGQRDPIAEEGFRIRRNGTEEEKEKARALNRKENWLVNVYVVEDPVRPENNGQIKVLRFGRQLNKIIMDAIEGDDAADFGARIFDLSPNGCNFRIKVEKQGDFPTYVSSKFALPKAIPGLDSGSIEEVYNNVFDLESYLTVKSYDELKDLLSTHYHCSTDVDEEPVVERAPTPVVTTTPKPVVSKPQAPVKEEIPTSLDSDDIADLLKGLE
jgi:gp32 DNA binding protein like